LRYATDHGVYSYDGSGRVFAGCYFGPGYDFDPGSGPSGARLI
jgi:hypothetical protein